MAEYNQQVLFSMIRSFFLLSQWLVQGCGVYVCDVGEVEVCQVMDLPTWLPLADLHQLLPHQPTLH